MIIGISGKATAGKDTVAKYFQAIWEVKKGSLAAYKEYRDQIIKGISIPMATFEIHSFGDNLKKCTSIITGCNLEDLYSQDFKKSKCDSLPDYQIINGEKVYTGSPMSYRQVLQRVGASIRESINPSVWITSLMSKYDNSKNWLVPDVRYKNEYKAIKSQQNSIIIRINRPGLKTGNHASEIDLDNEDNWDFVIENNGTLEDLYDKVYQIVFEIDKRRNK